MMWEAYDEDFDDYEDEEDSPSSLSRIDDGSRESGPRPFLWRTMEGETLTLAEMDTKHIFNSMKMLFNHLATAWGGKPVWFTKEYRGYHASARTAPDQLAWIVVMFIEEIEKRGDLPDRYRRPYREIVDQIRPRLIESERLRLPAPAILSGVK